MGGDFLSLNVSGDDAAEVIKIQKYGYAGYRINNTDFAMNDLPTSNKGLGRFICYDKNSEYLACFQSYYNADDTSVRTVMNSRNYYNGSITNCSLACTSNTDGVNDIIFTTGNTTSKSLRPSSTAQYADLGRSNALWHDLYLSGSLSDGTNSITIAEIVKAIKG